LISPPRITIGWGIRGDLSRLESSQVLEADAKGAVRLIELSELADRFFMGGGGVWDKSSARARRGQSMGLAKAVDYFLSIRMDKTMQAY